LAFAFDVGTITFGIGKDPALIAGMPPLKQRCSMAALLLNLLRRVAAISEPREAAAEVFAAAATPQKLLPLLHGAAGQMLEALESGAHTDDRP
jgi:hypothetical protein